MLSYFLAYLMSLTNIFFLPLEGISKQEKYTYALQYIWENAITFYLHLRFTFLWSIRKQELLFLKESNFKEALHVVKKEKGNMESKNVWDIWKKF